ncbi:MAG: tRNA pseudouridine(38-40) synthase TruA [Ruminococcaceae bacterium]|nr:tRNA pseudouridine(38-40) synthase TruA [Oscillospiraceae bacterium]
MKKVLLTIAYNGKNYHGYQLQEELPTVALMLNRAVCAAFGFECNVTGCSRTDAGVHALGFCASVEPRNEGDEITVPIDKIPIAINIKLPSDISVLKAREVPLDFHPRYDVVSKEYIYKIHASRIKNPFYDGLALEYGREISDTGLDKMNNAAQHFVGTHKFDSFMAQGSQIEDTERTVYEAKVYRNGDLVEFSVIADGFLYNMVRIMVGTLLRVECGKISPEDIPGIINSQNREKAGFTAKPDGLYLSKIKYKP